MTRDLAKREVKARYVEYSHSAKKRGTYICLLCGNETGNALKCFKCGFYGKYY